LLVVKKDVSKSAVIVMRFTIEDQYLIQCPYINKKYEAKPLSQDVS